MTVSDTHAQFWNSGPNTHTPFSHPYFSKKIPGCVHMSIQWFTSTSSLIATSKVKYLFLIKYPLHIYGIMSVSYWNSCLFKYLAYHELNKSFAPGANSREKRTLKTLFAIFELEYKVRALWRVKGKIVIVWYQRIDTRTRELFLFSYKKWLRLNSNINQTVSLLVCAE